MQKLIGKMARMYPALIAMGFMIVAAAAVIGALNSQTAATYFAESKAVRETQLFAQRATLESTGLWLPHFKFLGIGLILGGIVMALRVIIDHLRAAGEQVLANLPAGKRPAPPAPPRFASLMPILMMAGEAIFVVALVVALRLAGLAGELFARPIPDIDAAGAGSALLAQLQTIHVTSAWLVPLKFFGVATEFLAIVVGLATIARILAAQTQLIGQGIQIGRSMSGKGQGEGRRSEAA